MKVLHKYMLKSFLGPLALTLAIALFVFLMQFVFIYIDDLVGKGLAFRVIAKLLIFVTLTLVPLALPLAILLASIMTFGNLAENHELACMKAAGLSLPKIMAPLIILIIAISGGAFVFSNNVLPWINLKKDALLYDIRIAKPALNIQQEIFYNGINGYSIRIGKKDPDQETIHNVMIYDHTDPDNSHPEGGDFKVILAKSGKMKMSTDQRYLVLNLYDGNVYQEMIDNASYRITHPLTINNFKEQTVYLDLSNFRFSRTNEDLFKSNYEMLNIKQLKTTADSMTKVYAQTKVQFYSDFSRTYFDKIHLSTNKLKDEGNLPQQAKVNIIEAAINNVHNALQFVQGNSDSQNSTNEDILKRRIEIHKKFTFAIACFLLFFIGAPFGAIIRKGGLGMPVVVSSLFFILFYILTIIGVKSAMQETMSIPEGLWLPSAVLLPLGAFFTYKASVDSALFETEAYISFFTRLVKKKIKT
jgi:lipopolysaccharide export system permease protein